MSQYRILPPNVSESEFNQALTAFRGIVGDKWLKVDDKQLKPYMRLQIPVDERTLTPCGALAPASVEEIQAILKIANQYKIPLWTISTGKNLGYGAALPATAGQMVLDLKRMNKILELDAEMGTALLEPGVTYQQLYEYIQQNNIPLWIDMPSSSAIAGPVGNTLDRGVGYTPYGDHFMTSCGMEVVMADGQILRTGMGGLENNNTWQLFKWGFGPYLDGIFTQSNYGIVTKMGMWLLPKPPVYKPFRVTFENRQDIVKIVELVRPLSLGRIIPNACVIAGASTEFSMFVDRADYWQEDTPLPDHIVEKIREDHDIGAWNVYAALYGTPDQVDASWKIIDSAFSSIGGRVQTEKDLRDSETFQFRKDIMKGKPNLHEFGFYNWRGGGGAFYFAPVCAPRGLEAKKQIALAKTIVEKHGLDYTAEFIVGWRDLHHVVAILYNRQDENHRRQAYACFDELLDVFAAQGYGTYRTNTAFMEKVASQFGGAKRSVEAKIKKALDPNSILSPGKSGIY